MFWSTVKPNYVLLGNFTQTRPQVFERFVLKEWFESSIKTFLYAWSLYPILTII